MHISTAMSASTMSVNQEPATTRRGPRENAAGIAKQKASPTLGSVPQITVHQECNATTTTTATLADSDNVIPPALANDHFCVNWQVQMDDWWTHHPNWEAGTDNETHQCFQRISDNALAGYLLQIYHNQFHSKKGCGKVYTRPMWSSGWEADIYNVVDGLKHGMFWKRPFQVSVLPLTKTPWWHYAAMKRTGANATCATKDMFCYFLPLTNCTPNLRRVDTSTNTQDAPHNRWERDFITRPLQWLRRRVYEYLRDHAPPIEGRCSVIHVRRSDVILHSSGNARKYFPISQYVRQLSPDRMTDTLLLLTDDANAIDEAAEFFPSLKWKFLNRSRHRGDAGGFENQIPSQNPALEVVIIKAIFKWVQSCDVIVHGAGGFSDAIAGAMQQNGKRTITRLRVEGNDTEVEVVFHANNTASKQALALYLERERLQKQVSNR
jgi:hypothetical protein